MVDRWGFTAFESYLRDNCEVNLPGNYVAQISQHSTFSGPVKSPVMHICVFILRFLFYFANCQVPHLHDTFWALRCCTCTSLSFSAFCARSSLPCLRVPVVSPVVLVSFMTFVGICWPSIVPTVFDTFACVTDEPCSELNLIKLNECFPGLWVCFVRPFTVLVWHTLSGDVGLSWNKI